MRRKGLWLAALAGAAGSLAAEVSYKRQGDVFLVSLREGGAELEFLSASSFRYRRCWEGCATRGAAARREGVGVQVREVRGEIEFRTKAVRVRLDGRSGGLRVEEGGGAVLLADAREPRREGRRAILERRRPAGERFAGLGVTAELEGGVGVQTERPFLMSSLGYGEYFRRAGRYRYEFSGFRRIEAPGGEDFEYFFYYGPTPKEILEEHLAVSGGLQEVDWGMFRVGSRPPKEGVALPAPKVSWEGLRETLRQVFRASYSAILLPALDVAAYGASGGEVARRAMQAACYLPAIYCAAPGEGCGQIEWLRKERGRWAPYLTSYGYEAQERGFPLVRPPAMQYPKDGEAAHYEDEFFLGDELLVAPVLGPEGRRRVYLPMGIWTELHTNRRYPGRQAVEVEAGPDWIPVFAKNGSIVPLAAASGQGAMEAHYFPRLGGEFFLYEEGSGALTQLHAAPAGELLRLEVAPAVRRTIEWVVHHVERCRQVRQAEGEYVEVSSREQLRPGGWWYDAERKNLHVQTTAAPGSDHVLHVAF